MTVAELIQKYPKIYVPYEGNPFFVNWLDLPPGWIPLVDKMLNYIQWNIDNNGWEQVQCTQQKEKWGILNWYFSGGDDKSEAVIDFVEHLSGSICESCGTTENIGNTSGWITTVCKKCVEEKQSYNNLKNTWKPI